MLRQRINFIGRVQGVGFRMTAEMIAQRHPVTGWVRNEPDGSVLLEVQGEEDAIAGFLDELRRRMAGFIERERAETISPLADDTSFGIAFH